MGTNASYVENLIKNQTIKKVRIQGNVESSMDIEEEDVIENIVKLIKTLQPYYDNIIENLGGIISQEQLNRNSNNTKLSKSIDHITEWVISCNPSYYDVIGAFNELECIEWKQSTNIKVGDIVYIYVSSPVKEIKYKCIARKVNLNSAGRIDDSKFMIDDSNYRNYGRYMELELITKYQDKQYTLNDLKQHGLRSVQGPSKLSEELQNYIKLTEISKIKEIKKSLKSKHNLEADINEIEPVELKEFYGYKHEKKKKQKPKVQDGVKIYPRDRNVAMNALLHANYKCEVDQNHPTFIRKNLDINYTESHHLVPMAYSDLFNVSLDVEENIVSLCSNCHNLLHYGRDFKDILEKLYNERKEDLNKVGIDITFEQLLNMYL